MMRLSSMLMIAILSAGLLACGSDKAEEEKGVTVTYTNEDGERESVNVNVDDIDINTDEISKSLEEAFENLNLERNAENLEEAFGKMANSLSESLNDGEKVETMNFRDIKATLPSRLLGLERTDYSGEKNGMFGFSIAQAEATYEEDDQRIKVSIVDGGNMGVAKLGAAAWAGMEVDRENNDGYERTTEIDGHKAFEKYEARRERAELALLYKDRYIITLEGRSVDGDDLRRALRKIDYGDLD